MINRFAAELLQSTPSDSHLRLMVISGDLKSALKNLRGVTCYPEKPSEPIRFDLPKAAVIDRHIHGGHAVLSALVRDWHAMLSAGGAFSLGRTDIHLLADSHLALNKLADDACGVKIDISNIQYLPNGSLCLFRDCSPTGLGGYAVNGDWRTGTMVGSFHTLGELDRAAAAAGMITSQANPADGHRHERNMFRQHMVLEVPENYALDRESGKVVRKCAA